MKRFTDLSLIFLLILAFMPVSITYGEIKKPALKMGPNHLKNIIVNPNAPIPDGKITYVKLTPENLWRTGTTVYIEWTWPDYPNAQADVTIWQGSRQVATVITDTTKSKAAWIVPYHLVPGSYSVKVQSSKNPDNHFGRVIHIENSTISMLSPKTGMVLEPGSNCPIIWEFQGKPGPLKLELFSGSASNTPHLLIANNIASGELGAGRYEWKVPSGLPSKTDYWIKATATVNSAIHDETSYLTIGEMLPELQNLSSTAVSPSDKITVTGKNFNNILSWAAVIELQTGQKFEIPISMVSATKFSVNIPNIYQGLNVASKNAEHRQKMQQIKSFYVKRGNVNSNKLLFNIRSLYPILDQITKMTVYPGDVIFVNGGNWEQAHVTDYIFEFQLPNRKVQTKAMLPPVPAPIIPVPNFPNISLVGMCSVKIPDVFSGRPQSEQDAINKGTQQLVISGRGMYASNPLNIQIRKKTASSNSSSPSNCPGGQYISGYAYVGKPGCATGNRADHPSAFLNCDASGYYCCENAPGAKTKCGTDRWTFQPDCFSYCASAAGNCTVQPVIINGVFYGCYKSVSK